MTRRTEARRISREMMRRVLAVETADWIVGSTVDELAVPGATMRAIRIFARGQNREDCLAMLGHMAAMVRLFAAEIPVARRDQMLAELREFDAACDEMGVGQ